MPKKIDFPVHEQAVKVVSELRAEYPPNARTVAGVASQEGVGAEC